MKQATLAVEKANALDTKIPPPILVLLTGIAMWGIARLDHAAPIAGIWRWPVAGLLGIAGLLIAGSGVAAFRRAKTTINPINPHAASAIVSGGIYGYTRNPMYVGMATLLIGWAVCLAAPWALAGPVLFVLFINQFQILPEERALMLKFGDEYAEYRRHVRRWM